MYLKGRQLVLSASDLTRFIQCRHLTGLDLGMAAGRYAAPDHDDAARELLFERGLAHERTYLQSLHEAGLDVVEIAGGPDLARAERDTIAAMESGADVVYQGTFFDGVWRGHADFLEKRPGRPSLFGDWSYDLADTKLAHRVKVDALVQMATYAERLTVLQGVPPEFLTVVTGEMHRRSYRLTDCAAYTRRATADLQRFLDELPVTYPDPVHHCSVCRWDPVCTARRRSDDSLTFVAGMRRLHANLLTDAGVSTLALLGTTQAADLPPAIGAAPRERLAAQARLQLAERETGHQTHELLPAEPRRGLSRLPEPSQGDLFFDMEGDPFVGDCGLEYLFGCTDVSGGYSALWAHDSAAEKAAFETFVDRLMVAWAADPGMHVYHYASYEKSVLQRLSARYDTRIDEVDRILRGERLVDLYAVVRQGVRVSKESYSLKKLEAFFAPDIRDDAEVSDAAGSIIAYERWLERREQAELDAIERYNAVDCRSTQHLRDWLESLRNELVATGATVLRPDDDSGVPAAAQTEANTATTELRAALLAAHPDSAPVKLLADLLDWHRREARSEWWEFFNRLEMSDEELARDTAAVGLLGPATFVREDGRSSIWHLEFPPQETKLAAGPTRYIDPRTKSGVGTVVDIDPELGWLEIKRQAKDGPVVATSLVPPGPFNDNVLRAAVARVGEDVLSRGPDAPGRMSAARDLLARRPPAGSPPGPLVRPGETPADAVTRLALDLRDGVLAVQGPPGSGKTWSAARMILALIDRGKRVGICAFSHKAIGNLLDEVFVEAERTGRTVRAMQKATEDERCVSKLVDSTTAANDVVAALETLDLVAGTAWLFARPDMVGAVDTLVIDEAGQMSLANVLAVAGAADNLALFGDPQQLSQPGKGVHPPGAEVSALEHLLGGAATIDPDLGVFLDRTWRMHPAICDFVSQTSYDGRLLSHDSCSRQRVEAPGRLSGSGLRWVPVAHQDNSAASGEEADVVRGLLDDLLAGSWTAADGIVRPVTLADVLVIAPYNAQVGRLRSRLPDAARVGTVDKFQGQEAPVVIYSMASSSIADAPRGVDFLFNRNRLNVAVSRARGLVAIVASPRLLDAPVRSAEQLVLVNALCRFSELAAEGQHERIAGSAHIARQRPPVDKEPPVESTA
ncbi:MAG: TM0106 family RecB-like putative nuclease [Mycobacteriales bacterium]